MILTGHLMLPAGPGRLRLTPGTLRLDRARIAEVRPGPIDPHADLGHERCVIAPGFVDAHVHLPQWDSVGIHGLTLLDWLERAVFPAEARWADPEHAGAMTARVARELLALGTTAVAAYATVHHDATRAAIHALARAGLRAHVGQVLMDRNAPPELCRPAHQLLKEAAALTPDARVQPAVTPRFAVACTDELLAGAGALARATAQAVQTHLSETRAEVELVRHLFRGLDYTDVYDRAGLLTPRTILAHAVHATDDELATLADAKAVVAHCPTANLFLRSGLMDRARVAAAGVRVALGSDIAGGPERSMPRVARAMLETAAALDLRDDEHPEPHAPPQPRTLTADQAWHQITAANADALGWTSAARLSPGADADLVLIEPDASVPLPDPHAPHFPHDPHAPDPLASLLWGWLDRWVTRTIVAGRIAHTSPAATRPA